MKKLFISKIRVFMTLIVLPGGQLAEKGMAINFPCGLRTVEQCLPNLSAFDKVIAASFESREDTAKLSHVIRRDVLV